MMLAANLLWAEWISLSALVSLIGFLVIYANKTVPDTLQRVFKYGKAAELHTKSSIKKLHRIELPKRWFFHFYLFATIFYISLLISFIDMYILRQDMQSNVATLLDTFVGHHRRASVTSESAILAMTLMLVQVTRRLVECSFLSVYSDAKMNVIHYIFGFLFYFGVGLSVIAEAPGFSGQGLAEIYFGALFNKWHYAGGLILFLSASYLQYECHSILANLRKDNKGQVISYQHSIPESGLFEYVSCPHYFAEILIYLAINLIFLGQSMTWWMVCTFVIINQIIVGLFNHQWYHQTFDNYPQSRKAVIPFIF
ncbi:Polyprenol reductase [Halotydeus destructor]|nr:Polyprenol reductase [Halotydeus destructor]